MPRARPAPLPGEVRRHDRQRDQAKAPSRLLDERKQEERASRQQHAAPVAGRKEPRIQGVEKHASQHHVRVDGIVGAGVKQRGEHKQRAGHAQRASPALPALGAHGGQQEGKDHDVHGALRIALVKAAGKPRPEIRKQRGGGRIIRIGDIGLLHPRGNGVEMHHVAQDRAPVGKLVRLIEHVGAEGEQHPHKRREHHHSARREQEAAQVSQPAAKQPHRHQHQSKRAERQRGIEARAEPAEEPKGILHAHNQHDRKGQGLLQPPAQQQRPASRQRKYARHDHQRAHLRPPPDVLLISRA